MKRAAVAFAIASFACGCSLVAGIKDFNFVDGGAVTEDAASYADVGSDVKSEGTDAGGDAALVDAPGDVALDTTVLATTDANDASDDITDASANDVDEADEPIALSITSSTMNYNIAVNAGSPARRVDVILTIAAGVTVGSTSSTSAAITTGTFVGASTVTIVNHGLIVGAGGSGGSGGKGETGAGTRPCGRAGLGGGNAIELTVATTIMNFGSIFGGGGGGAGASGNGENAGGGGGAGVNPGGGGAGATTASAQGEATFCGGSGTVLTGTDGAPGTTLGGNGGDAGLIQGGRGGDYGLPGESTPMNTGVNIALGGNAGNAIKRGANSCNIADGAYDDPMQSIRGPVGP